MEKKVPKFDLQAKMGFRPTGGSVHLSRTLMLEDRRGLSCPDFWS